MSEIIYDRLIYHAYLLSENLREFEGCCTDQGLLENLDKALMESAGALKREELEKFVKDFQNENHLA